MVANAFSNSNRRKVLVINVYLELLKERENKEPKNLHEVINQGALALGSGFSQFSQPVFQRCLDIIQTQQLAKVDPVTAAVSDCIIMEEKRIRDRLQLMAADIRPLMLLHNTVTQQYGSMVVEVGVWCFILWLRMRWLRLVLLKVSYGREGVLKEIYGTEMIAAWSSGWSLLRYGRTEAELSQQVQAGMENMLKMITEIDQSSSGIIEEIEKCKYSAFERKRSLEEDKDEEVDKVLTSLAGETAAQLPEAVDKWWGYYFQKLLIFFTTNEAPYLCLFLSRLEIYFKHQLDDKIFKGQFRHSASFGNCKKKQDLRALTGSFLVWCYLAAGVFHRSLLLLLVEMGPSEKEKDHTNRPFEKKLLVARFSETKPFAE
ncbi:hypothetical protein LXL04_034012 [Taraxacum kok-saghyz]